MVQQDSRDDHLRLGLGDIDNGATHAANEDHAALGLTGHQVTSNRGGKQVGAIHIDRKELAESINGVVSGLEVLGEASRGHKVVNLAMTGEDISNASINTVWVRDVGKVSSDFGGPVGEKVVSHC